MTEREAIIKALSKYFTVKELVCPHCYAKFGERSWQFYDTDLLHCLLILRETVLCAPMYVNNGKQYTQRGLRCNLCAIVKGKATVYLSGHVLGKAVDFTVQGMSAEEARKKIIANADLFPCNVRLEAGVSWCHFDVLPTNSAKVYVFQA